MWTTGGPLSEQCVEYRESIVRAMCWVLGIQCESDVYSTGGSTVLAICGVHWDPLRDQCVEYRGIHCESNVLSAWGTTVREMCGVQGDPLCEQCAVYRGSIVWSNDLLASLSFIMHIHLTLLEVVCYSSPVPLSLLW